MAECYSLLGVFVVESYLGHHKLTDGVVCYNFCSIWNWYLGLLCDLQITIRNIVLLSLVNPCLIIHLA